MADADLPGGTPGLDPIVDVVIPALDEAKSIGDAIRGVPPWIRRVIVADNGSTDSTWAVAQDAGAIVVDAARRGYGSACMTALTRIAADPPDVVVFMDADGSDVPSEMDALIAPIRAGAADLVIGSRVLGHAQPGSLTVPQRFGNALATFLIRRLWGGPCTDLGPFRAVRWQALRALAMDDLDYGWTVQMQARAAKARWRIVEVPVSYRRRVGVSKISGTVRGVIGAGTKILGTIGVEAVRRRQMRVRTIIMSRLPVPGSTKTRLIPALGAAGAADLHAAMTAHTVSVVRHWMRAGVRRAWIAESEVRTTGGTPTAWAERFGWRPAIDGPCRDQGDGDLGARLTRAVADAFADGVDAVIAIGCDCPDLDASVLTAASERIGDADVVIAPADDGGYCLIAMRSGKTPLFEQIDWGSDRVLDQTMDHARAAGLRVDVLPTLGDVDLPEDVPRWDAVAERARSATARPRVSIVIPAFNEARRIASTIDSARQADDIEIIVVDGGSDDGTPDVAESLGAQVLRTKPGEPRGRAVQMNRGAEVASSELLLFLHADTRLPFGYLDDIEPLHDEDCPTALAFRLGFDALTPSLRVIERCANWRSVWWRRPYGDQALAMTRAAFERVGGFPDVAVMEDCAIVRALRRAGEVHLSRRAVITSSRRWFEHGVWRTTLRHQFALLGSLLGVSPRRLARFLGRTDGGGARALVPDRLHDSESTDHNCDGERYRSTHGSSDDEPESNECKGSNDPERIASDKVEYFRTDRPAPPARQQEMQPVQQQHGTDCRNHPDERVADKPAYRFAEGKEKRAKDDA